jgi:threonine/homoserine/homoserine lactone efflux protein
MSDAFRLITKSFLIGLTAAATLGPIALICIQRTLRHGWRVGAASGFGVAIADGLYGLVGALGLKALTDLLLANQQLLGLAGGSVLVYIGIRTFRSTMPTRQDTAADAEKPPSRLVAAGSIFLLTLSNPVTIMFFSAVYAGLMVSGSLLTESVPAGFGLFALGVFSGSFSWWLILVTFISAARSRFQLQHLGWLNRLSGLAIAGFGVWVLLRQLIA